MELSILIPLILIVLILGAIAGFIAGLLGVGGGIVLVPAFYYLFQSQGYVGGQIMQICVATSLATIVVTSISSTYSHYKKGAVDFVILKNWAPGIVLGAIIGVLFVSGISSRMLTAIFGLLGFIVGVYFLSNSSKWKIADKMPIGSLAVLWSTAIGFLSTLMGIGGGGLGMPIMSLHGVTTHRSLATAAGFGLLIAVPSVIGFLLARPVGDTIPPYTIGFVNLPIAALVITMTVFTAPIGARTAHRTSPNRLRKIFAVFLILVAFNMVIGAWRG